MSTHKITTLDQLVYNLNLGPGYDGYKSLIQAIDLSTAELNELCEWMSQDHMRISVYDTPGLEAVITYWRPGNKTPIHNYSFQQGWIKVMKGTLSLEYFDVDSGIPGARLMDKQLIEAGEFIYLNDGFGYHRFKNIGDEEAIAVHLYADKITERTVFHEETGMLENVQTQYHKKLA